MKESPLFVKAYEFLLWLIPLTQKFPKSQRFVMAKRIEDAALSFYELLIEAGKRPDNDAVLLESDLALEKLRLHLRLCRDLKLTSIGQYEHASRMVVEIGKMLGAWIKKKNP
jgi:four helix bundle protein